MDQLVEGDGRDLVLVNPQHLRAVPGRTTDLRDAAWLADRLRHGRLRASVIPPAPVRALRELTRSRTTLVPQRADEVNRRQKTLAGANLKRAAVATDVVGVRGRARLEALLGGEQDPAALADLARGRRRATLPALRPARLGRGQPHHLVLVRERLAHLDFLEDAIARRQEEIEGRLPACEADMGRLQTIPGVGAVAAAAILAEVGPDMGRFPTATHLASWAGRCPGNTQRGGTRLKRPSNTGNVWLRGSMGEVAWASVRRRDPSFAAQSRRLARRRGKQKAAVAVAHRLLVVIYHVLRDRRPYHELGAGSFDTLDVARLERHHVRRREQLGYAGELKPKEAAA